MSASYYATPPRYPKRRRFEWLSSCCGIFEDYDPIIYHPEMYTSSSATNTPQVEEEKQVSGIWKKNILMGGKCKLPEFSGVIIYDNSGNLVPNSKPPRLALPWK